MYAAYHAYSSHHHLIIRPEDVWFAILSQTNFFINAHAEELRSYFVTHDGQKELEVIEVGTLHSVDFGQLAQRMTKLIQKNVIDPDLRAWIMPSFSTTTDSDRVVASILMMGALQKYFSYLMTLTCGIPSVTLLGEREDWADMQSRLAKLGQLGNEPAQFAQLLTPVLSHFVKSFDDPQSPSVSEFWSKIAHQTGGSGPYFLSGWITAFCFWDEEGNCLYKNGAIPPVTLEEFAGRRAGCELDGVYFHRVDTDDIPPGYASVPVTVNDNGRIYHTELTAGSVGMQATSSGGMLDGDCSHDDPNSYTMGEEGEMVPYVYVPAEPTEEPGLDTIQPVSGWWMYEVEKPTDAQTPATKCAMQEDSAMEDANEVGLTRCSSDQPRPVSVKAEVV